MGVLGLFALCLLGVAVRAPQEGASDVRTAARSRATSDEGPREPMQSSVGSILSNGCLPPVAGVSLTRRRFAQRIPSPRRRTETRARVGSLPPPFPATARRMSATSSTRIPPVCAPRLLEVRRKRGHRNRRSPPSYRRSSSREMKMRVSIFTGLTVAAAALAIVTSNGGCGSKASTGAASSSSVGAGGSVGIGAGVGVGGSGSGGLTGGAGGKSSAGSGGTCGGDCAADGSTCASCCSSQCSSAYEQFTSAVLNECGCASGAACAAQCATSCGTGNIAASCDDCLGDQVSMFDDCAAAAATDCEANDACLPFLDCALGCSTGGSGTTSSTAATSGTGSGNCTQDGQFCLSDSECCGDFCNDANSCGCAAAGNYPMTGGHCTTDADCCNSVYCWNETFGKGAGFCCTLLGVGESCSSDADCCSGVCDAAYFYCL